MNQQFNVLGQPLQTCSLSSKTGFYRDGSCHTGDNDYGSHTVCCIVSQEFLEFSKSKGNDLITPAPRFDFPGLKAGDKWCVCALRWKEAYEAGAAPKVSLMSTHQNVLKFIELDMLLPFAVDLPKNA